MKGLLFLLRNFFFHYHLYSLCSSLDQSELAFLSQFVGVQPPRELGAEKVLREKSSIFPLNPIKLSLSLSSCILFSIKKELYPR